MMELSDLEVVGEERGKARIMKYRISVVEILRFLKQYYSYKELSQIVGIDETTLCRYIRGSSIPSFEKARKELGWKPKVKLERGLREFIAWLRAR